ncbi:ABC transporter permease [Propioniciclava soli]|uniref:ABC transporter permease n=1 Tax=Propioniciclava soli TaxID=2775081 RepID=A0ABZ3CCR2_9ACTN
MSTAATAPTTPPVPVTPEGTDERRSPVRDALRASLQQLFVFAALIVVFVFFMAFANNFDPVVVIPNILLQAAAIGTMALGATFIIATGGIDLSVGTGMTFCAVMAGVFMSSAFMNLPLGVGLLLTLGVGVAIGLVNGILIAFLDIPPFIATLAMMMVTRGLSLIISGSSSIRIENPDYAWISNGRLLPFLSNAALIFILLGVVAAVLLGKTLLGRYALAIGSNEEATRLSGINVRLWKTLVYVTAGVFTALGAILYSGRFGFVQPAEGLGMELQVIAAVVIGGTSLAGGRANIVGTMMGALLMMTLSVGLQMMGVAQQWQLVVTGVVVLMAVYADILRRKRAASL